MISWNEVLIFNFGVAEDTNDKQYKDNTQEIEQDQLRFDLADDNNDGLLTVEECFVFLHPELYNHMKDLITWKFFAEYDKDKDGSISLVEYIGKKSRHEEKWVSKANKAKKAFEIIDSNKNGKLEVPEALAVLLPNYHRDAQDEASKIMKNVDENGDGQLSLKEVKKHYKVFTENEHVDFTSQLRRIRDEL
ncbi:calumenin-A-like [Saccoglossus kowalevskii]|uniref:Calumenin-A-like n=1 Tax=Saccoglossus kowalevskii TaxID=10224 RepID=A0ABM0MU48_SACKO|nr:PREDICTED: calumenin-A-like [Saccoglossus kowalevskii]